MELERVAVVLRPRSAWESADLGVAMLQRWWGAVLAAWCLTVLPILLAILVYARGSFILALLAIWWLAPLFERVPLYVLSRALFGATPSVVEVLRALPRIWGRGFLPAVTIHRLHPFRSLAQPVGLLEGLRGRVRIRREAALIRDRGPLAFGVALLCLAFEISLVIGGVLLAYVLVPAELLPDFDPFWAGDFAAFDPGWFIWVPRLVFAAVYTLIGPLHAAVGFALYIDRRSHLEGWDVELAFRRLAARVERSAKVALERGVAALLVIALAIAALGSRADAQDVAPPSEPAFEQTDDPAVAIEEVLAHEDFERMEHRTSWRLRGGDDGGERMSLDWLGFLAPLIEALLWVAVAALVVFLAVVIGRRLGWVRQPKAAPPPAAPPSELFGLDLRPESLPADVPAAALELWRRGQAVEALGLLYRGAIARLVERDGLALERSDTESDCLRRARALRDLERVGYFADVTRTWLACAYASILPSGDAVERLCSDWRARFERSAA